jgi:hypothetical protein
MASWSSIGCCGSTHADSRNLTPVNLAPEHPTKKAPRLWGFFVEHRGRLNRQGNFCLGGGLSGPRGDYQNGDTMRKTLIVGVPLGLVPLGSLHLQRR